ncbi:MAG TPA: DUF992 domain-containing protein [Caulobacteraceae bacterium]|nr:DUF992 domain-containing protein [Caulobacteraceae bacterium]
MRISHRPILGAMAAGALALAAAAPANAQQPDQSGVRVGVLTCNEASGWGVIFGSSHEIHCTLDTNGRIVARYNGHIDKFGVDIGYQSGGVLVWAVVAPTSGAKPGSLNGSYAGLTAGAAVGVGASANVLVGGLDRSIALQPLSVEGMNGLNLAAGIGAMSLEYVPD